MTLGAIFTQINDNLITRNNTLKTNVSTSVLPSGDTIGNGIYYLENGDINFIDKLNANANAINVILNLLHTNDLTLANLQEIVDYIKTNASTISALNVSNI